MLEGSPERRLVVSGDLGRAAHPLLCAPEPPDAADWLLVESTFAVHGEPPAAAAFVARVDREIGWPIVAPRDGEVVRL